MSRDAGPAPESDDREALVLFARTHRPNYVVEAPGRDFEWTRIKCDGDECAFYAESHGWRNWYAALDAWAEHLADAVLAAGFRRDSDRPGGDDV